MFANPTCNDQSRHVIIEELVEQKVAFNLIILSFEPLVALELHQIIVYITNIL